MIQDSAWEGYVEIPTWVMQGYVTLVGEALDQIKAIGKDMTTIMAGLPCGASYLHYILYFERGNKHDY